MEPVEIFYTINNLPGSHEVYLLSTYTMRMPISVTFASEVNRRVAEFESDLNVGGFA